MIRLCFFSVLFFVIGQDLFAQDNARIEVDSTFIDTKYREDQFYASLTYNLLANKPSNVGQSGFSSGIHLGFIRDMPLNERRNIALGLGIGVSTNSYNQTLRIEEINENEYTYLELDDNGIAFTKNKFSTYIIELPIEFRWRTSTTTEYDFWRIYTGVKLGYVFYNSAKFESSTENDFVSNISDFNNFQYGLTLSAGYDTINFFVYYGLNDLFKDSAKLQDETITMNAVRIGLIFYIL